MLLNNIHEIDNGTISHVFTPSIIIIIISFSIRKVSSFFYHNFPKELLNNFP